MEPRSLKAGSLHMPPQKIRSLACERWDNIYRQIGLWEKVLDLRQCDQYILKVKGCQRMGPFFKRPKEPGA